jgi:Tfp pilus assembly protein PilX
MMRRSRHRDDSGAALILVLVIVTVLALGIAAISTFASTSVHTTVALRDQGSSVYNADGAVQAAINNIRNSAYNDSAGQTCFSGGNTLQVPYGSGSVAVTCTADPARVLIQCPSLANCNRPGNAILTLGKVAGEDGVNVQQPTGSAFRVHGNIFSNSNINVVNGNLATNAKVWARGACSGTIVGTGGTACNYGTTANALGDDPGYSPAAAVAPAYQPLPACITPNSLVTFQPGYYDDADGLSKMMAGNSACKKSTWWFKPGTYYFDFHNSGTSANPLLNAGTGNIWTVNDGYLVGGTPANAAGQAIATPPVPAAIPGSCVNPIDTATASGVQFIFGGDSQFAIKSGEAEICGTYNVSKAPIALYGLTSGSAATTSLTGSDALKLTAVPSTGAFKTSATVPNLSSVNGAFASWTSGKKSDSGTLTVSGFAPPSAIPAGSVLTGATVKVTHRHSDSGSTDSTDVILTPTGGVALPSGSAPGHAGSSTFQTDGVAVDTARTGSLASAIHAGTYSGASIALTSNLSANADIEDIDSIQLELTYVPPAYRAESGCVINGPYTGLGSATTCALVTSVNNVGNQFYVQGTTYAPNAVLDITLNNAAEQVFRFGVIARSLWIKETGSFSYSGVVIEVPDDSPGFVFGVYLDAYVCPTTSTCTPTAGAKPELKAKVAFVDDDPAAPTVGKRQVLVESWNATR